MKKRIALVLVLILMAVVLASCTQAERVSANLSKEADAFNVTRRLAVINARTDKPVFELVGAFSISNNMNNELEITVQTGPNEYKKHFVYLNEWTLYVVEDISGANVSPYHYEVNFLPEMIVPIKFTSSY
jgi:hypothetical protein